MTLVEVAPVEFPEDVFSEILSRLRVKDLTRYKCVCKTWLRLISSQVFICLHLSKSMLRAIRIPASFDSPYLHLPPTWPILPQNVNRTKVSSICFKMQFLGSFDGLVCLYNTICGVMNIWNPTISKSTSMYVKRPPHCIITSCWFGRHGDEYKVVMVTKTHMHLIGPHFGTYSWKSTQEVGKHYSYYENIGTLFNSNVHWPASYYVEVAHCRTIVCYDLGKETVGEIPLPAVGHNYSPWSSLRLGEVDGCLSAMFSNSKEVELWVMKEYGVKESWTKLMILPSNSGFHHHDVNRIKDEPELVLSDPATVKSLIYGKAMYVESLISPLIIYNLASIYGP